MTDVVTTPNSTDASSTASAAPATITDAELNAAAAAFSASGTAAYPTGTGSNGADSNVQWAPVEPHKRRRWPLILGIGIPVVALAAAAGYFGTTLIAPGVTVAGTEVGMMTPEAAAEKIQETVAATGVDVTLNDATVTVTGETLGATIDATALAQAAHADHALWMVGAWNPEPVTTLPTLDPTAAATALKSEFAAVWVDPIDATVTFDAASKAYVTTPGVEGSGITPAAVEDGYFAALVDPKAPTALEATPESLIPAITTDVATAQADALNEMLATAGFYVGEERTVGLDPERVSSWLTVTPDPTTGAFAVTADAAAIQGVVNELPNFVNRAPVDAEVIQNKNGKVIHTEVEGQTGRELGDTSAVANQYAQQLQSLNGNYVLPVTETEFETVAETRHIEVNLSTQTLTRYVNGEVYDSWLVSTGRPGGAETITGSYEVNSKLRSQTMYGTGRDNDTPYEVPNVQYPMYFNGDQAFHGVYWNDNYTRGEPGSNGCVGMSDGNAGKLHEWTYIGTVVDIFGTTPS